MKIIRTISIDSKIDEHIKRNPLVENFSKWITERYTQEFLTEDFLKEKQEQIQTALEHYTKFAEYKEDLREKQQEKHSELMEKIYFKLDEKSKLYLSRVPELLKKGFRKEVIIKSFCNNMLGYDIKPVEFEQLLRIATEEKERLVDY